MGVTIYRCTHFLLIEAAVPAKQGRQNHAQQIFVSGQSSAEAAIQPSGSERLQLKN
jgi:hypothetical protein